MLYSQFFYGAFFFTQRTRIQIWLYEQTNVRIEGRIIGFDEYMNVVLDDAEELDIKRQERKPLGRDHNFPLT